MRLSGWDHEWGGLQVQGFDSSSLSSINSLQHAEDTCCTSVGSETMKGIQLNIYQDPQNCLLIAVRGPHQDSTASSFS